MEFWGQLHEVSRPGSGSRWTQYKVSYHFIWSSCNIWLLYV